MPAVYGARLTTFEDSEKESEYGYVRKVCSTSRSVHSCRFAHFVNFLIYSIGFSFIRFLRCKVIQFRLLDQIVSFDRSCLVRASSLQVQIRALISALFGDFVVVSFIGSHSSDLAV